MRWLLTIVALIALLAIATWSSWSQPLHSRMSEINIAGSQLPHPTGPFGVGRTTLRLPAEPGSTGKSTVILVDLWYPSATIGRPEQRPGAGIKGLGLSQVAHAGAAIDAPAAPAGADAQTFPLLLYAPGWNGARNDNTFLFANLASHGYVVTTMDDIGRPDASPAIANEEDIGDFDLSSEGDLKRSLAYANRRLTLMTERVSFTLDALNRLDRAGKLGTLSGRIDHKRVGMIGFSFGGAVAAECALTEPRILAAVNMDGWLFGTSAHTLIEKPYLIFNSDYPALSGDLISAKPRRHYMAELTRIDRNQQLRQAERPETTALLFRRHDHSDFTDELFSPALTGYIKRWQRTQKDRLRMRATLDSIVLAFFERHLQVPAHPTPLPRFQGVEPLTQAMQ